MIIARLSSLLAVPKFSDREKNRQAYLLNIVIWLGLCLVLLSLILNQLFAPNPEASRLYHIGLIVGQILALILLRRGMLRQTALLYSIGLWLSILASTFGNGWPLYTTAGNLFVMTLLAGLLLGPEWGLAFACASALSALGVVFLEQAGYVIAQSEVSPFRGAGNFGASLLIVALIIWLNARDLHEADSSIQRRQSLLLKRSLQLEAAADIALAATAGTALDELLTDVVNLVAERFKLYCIVLFRIDKELGVLKASAISTNSEGTTTSQIDAIPLSARSILAHVARSGKPYLAKDITHDPLYLHFPRLPLTKSELALPIQVGEELFGVLDVLSSEDPPLDSDEINVLEVLTNHVGTAIHNRSLLETTQRHLEELIALHSIASIGINAANEDELIKHATEIVGQHLFPENFGVILLEEESGLLLHHQSYAERNGKEQPPIPSGAGITGLVALSGVPMRIGDVREEPKYISVDSGTRSELCVPIQAGEKILGVLNAESDKVDAFTKADEHLLQAVAGQLAISLERMRLYSDAQTRASELEDLLHTQDELSRLKDEFIQTVSHEFRTPLAIVSGYVELLEGGEFGDLPEEYAKPVGIIAQRVQVLSKLVNDLTAILEVHSAEERFESIQLAELLENLHQSLIAQALAEEHRLSFDLDVTTPPVLGEATYLRKAIENLVSNAIKFTPSGGKITVRLTSVNGWVRIEVQDTGIGIPESEIQRIFQRFYQVDGSVTRSYGGTGLGLALVREIVELHRGEMEVESEEGAGSLFVIKLPVLSQSRLF